MIKAVPPLFASGHPIVAAVRACGRIRRLVGPAFERSEANMGRRRAAKGPSASDDELLEAAIAQAQSERDGMEASKAEASHSASLSRGRIRRRLAPKLRHGS
jgi:hypothetical protein